MFYNTHERLLTSTPAEVWPLMASLSSSEDALWPVRRWPAMRFDRPLGVGARGGHGPVRYEVAAIEPQRSVVFRFTPDFGIRGSHRLEIEPRGQGSVLRHVLEGESTGSMHLMWPLAFRPLHDALIEDAFDRAEASLAKRAWQPRRLSSRVRLLRRLAARMPNLTFRIRVPG